LNIGRTGNVHHCGRAAKNSAIPNREDLFPLDADGVRPASSRRAPNRPWPAPFAPRSYRWRKHFDAPKVRCLARSATARSYLRLPGR
jgi:hypothetical protein